MRYFDVPGAQLVAADVERLWRFRLRFVRLKPEVDPPVDLEKFHALLVSATTVYWGENHAGDICGMLMSKQFDWEHRGQRRKGLLAEYAFVDPAYRGTTTAMVALLKASARMLWRLRRPEVWLGSVGYLQSCVAATRYMGEVHYLGDPGLPDEAQSFMQHLLHHANVTPLQDGRVVMRTIPPTPSAGWMRRHGSSAVSYTHLTLPTNREV